MKTKKLSLQIVEDEIAEIAADLHTELHIYGKLYKQRKNGFNDLKDAIDVRVLKHLNILRNKLLKQSKLN